MPALVILCREILVSGLREFLAAADVSLPVTRIAKVKTTVQVAAIAALIASSATERMLPGVTIGALIGMWVAAALTFYTGYAYLQAGLSHAQGDREADERKSPTTKRPPCVANRDRRETALFRLGPAEDRTLGRGACPSRRTSPRWHPWSTSSAAAGQATRRRSQKPELLRYAVNQEHARFDARVGPDDEVAFFPPVTGG